MSLVEHMFCYEGIPLSNLCLYMHIVIFLPVQWGQTPVRLGHRPISTQGKNDRMTAKEIEIRRCGKCNEPTPTAEDVLLHSIIHKYDGVTMTIEKCICKGILTPYEIRQGHFLDCPRRDDIRINGKLIRKMAKR